MPEKTYKARVEIAFVVEFNIDAVQEYEAAAVAEEIAWNESQSFTTKMCKNYRIPNIGVRCIETEEIAPC